ncbi:winged helix-turn-helix transcriptional regulator [Streptomyces triculaminicus]|uniref:Winged helix-turn-helix transcriptional regulator n=2 Tax=Streptomyces TaxID=1883 RepID=A0A939FKM3_9ACTN|nr:MULTISPECIES: MarR family winged helix-turn-helix transcriptional regulator [Streptomyces]MBO0652476.1 winged helix-turn-helix transcriptional regulator [Streptomyces triculaminicus]QSY51921.1 winged helix-turn-helix transcriptional regulator [Streptomyces griseocarneus]
MAAQEQYEELAKQLSAIGAVKRGLGRALPHDCPPATAALLALLKQHGDMRMSRLGELMGIDASVTSRHVAHAADRGWIDRQPDPLDKRSRQLSLTPSGTEKLREVSGRYTDALATCLRDWSDDDIGQLIDLMKRLRESFGECRIPRTSA